MKAGFAHESVAIFASLLSIFEGKSDESSAQIQVCIHLPLCGEKKTSQDKDSM